MGVTAWTDISYDGKELRKYTRRMYNYLDKETKSKNPDWDKIFIKMEAVSRISSRHVKIIELADALPRIKNLEKLIKHIPADVLAEAKAKAGI